MNELSAEDIAALTSLAERDTGGILARDWAALERLYKESAVRLPPNGPALQGRTAIRAWFEHLPPITAFTFTLVSLAGQAAPLQHVCP
jgi:ketosteroid isomerase-like protein